MDISQDKKIRCPWCLATPEYIEYHDTEWGVPTHDDTHHFEFLILEAAQAGLSWLTILRKRQAYKIAFADFDANIVATYGEKEINKLLLNEGIIRNRMKITAAINNAQHFLQIQKDWGSFDSYLWSFTENKVIHNNWKNMQEVPARSELSDKVSADLKKRGFSFIGTTIMYAHLQAVGVINDHIVSCFRHENLQRFTQNANVMDAP